MMNFRRKTEVDDGVSREDTHRKDMKVHVDIPSSVPFWVLGVLLAVYLMLSWVKANPETLAGFKRSLFTKETVSSTTTGEFHLASDLYTARRHECDVLLYQDGKREMTMILRYHVNVLYDMNQVSIRIVQQQAVNEQDTGSVSLEVRLPEETIEVVTEKYAGLTGFIADGELPGIEIFDMKGKFEAKEDDQLADAFLSLYNVKSSLSQLLKEESAVADKYLPYTSMLIENSFSPNLNKTVQEKKLAVVAEAQASVVSGLGKYFEAIGYEDVVVLDARGNQMAQ